MKRIFSLLGVCLLVGLTAPKVLGGPISGITQRAVRGLTALKAAPGGAPAAQEEPAKKPKWKTRDEYDAFQAILKATSPEQKISLANEFLHKYPTSDFIAEADVVKAQSYQQLKQVKQAISSAEFALKADPNNLFALNYLSYVLPFTYNPKAPASPAQLTEAESRAKLGLQLLQKQTKPASVSEDQFQAQVKHVRSNFNRALGFALLQQKDYANAVTYLKAAVEDEPNDSYTLSFLGQAYLYTNPPDYGSGLWYLARATSMAQQQKTPNAAALEKFYDQVYVTRHGSDVGAKDLVAQAAGSPNPPAGFTVAAAPKHPKTGNASVDAIYGIQDSLAVGGDQAQQAWGSLKGQPLGIIGFVEGVVPGTDPNTYVVRADVLPQDRGIAGDYDLELQTAQTDAQYLQLGDPIHFQGTIAAYTVTPKFVLTLSGVQIDNASLQMASERAKAAAQKAGSKKKKKR